MRLCRNAPGQVILSPHTPTREEKDTRLYQPRTSSLLILPYYLVFIIASLLRKVSQSHSLKQDSNTNIQTKIDWSLIQSSFEALLHNSDSDSVADADAEEAESPSQFNLEDILSGNTAFHQPPLDQARAYVERLVGTGAGTTPGDAFINGKHFDLDDVCWFHFALSLSLCVCVCVSC